jgi:hypothetical protein
MQTDSLYIGNAYFYLTYSLGNKNWEQNIYQKLYNCHLIFSKAPKLKTKQHWWDWITEKEEGGRKVSTHGAVHCET